MTGVSGSDSVGWLKRWMPSWSTLTRIGAVAMVSALSVVLRQVVPITTDPSPVDDALYARIAGYLAHGQWLGPFDQFTLLKGSAYPAFIALMFRSGVPFRVGEQLTYLLAAAAVGTCVWVVTRRRALALVAYVVLALDPVNFDVYGSRVTRDGWYSSLSMLFVAAFFLAVYSAVTRARLPWLASASVLAGVSGGAFWLCREEPIWIAPTILLVALGLSICRLVRWGLARPRTRPQRSRVLRSGGRLGLVFALVGITLIAPIAAIRQVNSRHYGVALTNDLVSGQFARAYADWRRVKAGTPSAADPITRSQREAAYRVSPAAKQLEPYLDPAAGCIGTCGENAWRGIRDAAAKAGYFRTESDAQKFFGELDAQIQAGCVSGQLSCTGRLPAELQSLQLFSAGPLFTYLRHWGASTLASTGFYRQQTKVVWLSPSQRLVFTQIVSGLPDSPSAANEQMSRFTTNIWPYRLLSLVYRLLLPCLLVFALIGMLLPIVRPRWPQAALSVLSCALAVGALSRLVFVALLDTTEFLTKGSDVRYLLPSHALLIAFGVVGTAQLADVLWTRIRARRTSDPAEQTIVTPTTGSISASADNHQATSTITFGER